LTSQRGASHITQSPQVGW